MTTSVMDRTPWDLLRYGNVDQGLALLLNAYKRVPSASHILELGIAYLWVGDYLAGWEHFQTAIERFPRSTSSFYGMAGIAQWCLNEPSQAVNYWSAGLDTRFADGAGGVQLPLLLLTASIVKPEVFPREEAERILRSKTKNPLLKNWPGPLVEFVLGILDKKTLEEMSVLLPAKTGHLS
jgi:hypothetical protein